MQIDPNLLIDFTYINDSSRNNSSAGPNTSRIESEFEVIRSHLLIILDVKEAAIFDNH